MAKVFTLDKQNKKLAGVCAGLANYFDIDVTLVRVLFLVAAFVGCSLGFWAYIVLWAVAPGDNNVPTV